MRANAFKCGKIGHRQTECRTPQCNECGKLGHESKDCWIKKKPNDSVDTQKRAVKQCFLCNKLGHIARDCWSKNQIGSALMKDNKSGTVSNTQSQGQNAAVQCQICKKMGHSAKDCWFRNQSEQNTGGKQNPQGQGNSADGSKTDQVTAVCLETKSQIPGNCGCVTPNTLKLACGRTMPIVTGACNRIDQKMPVKQGLVGTTEVQTLRDTGCSGVVVRKDLVNPEQFIGNSQTCMLIDGTILKVPLAKIYVHTPYFSGETEAMCMQKPVFDLIIGNISGATSPQDPNPNFILRPEEKEPETTAVMTRAASKKEQQKLKPLHVTEPEIKDDNMSAEKFQKL